MNSVFQTIYGLIKSIIQYLPYFSQKELKISAYVSGVDIIQVCNSLISFLSKKKQKTILKRTEE